jgi:hypothetical protein
MDEKNKKQELDLSSNDMVNNNEDTIMIPYSDDEDTKESRSEKINKGKQKEVVEEDNDFNKELSQVI